MPATRPRPGGFERGTAFAQSSTRGASAAIFLITACAFCRPAGAAQPAYTVSQKRKRGPDGETLGEWAKKLALKFKRDCDEGGGQLYGGNLTEALRVEGFPYSSSASVFKAHRDLQRVAGSTARPPAKQPSAASAASAATAEELPSDRKRGGKVRRDPGRS